MTSVSHAADTTDTCLPSVVELRTSKWCEALPQRLGAFFFDDGAPAVEDTCLTDTAPSQTQSSR